MGVEGEKHLKQLKLITNLLAISNNNNNNNNISTSLMKSLKRQKAQKVYENQTHPGILSRVP